MFAALVSLKITNARNILEDRFTSSYRDIKIVILEIFQKTNPPQLSYFLNSVFPKLTDTAAHILKLYNRENSHELNTKYWHCELQK